MSSRCWGASPAWEVPSAPKEIRLLYLLDANVLIRAHHDYYPLDRLPGFWEWLCGQAEAGAIKMPFEIHREVATGNDALATWISQSRVEKALLLDEEVDQNTLRRVLDTGYGPNLTEDEIAEAGDDPFLVAYGTVAGTVRAGLPRRTLMGDSQRTVVTKEISKPSRQRGNTKLPDACQRLGVPWITDFELYRRLDFRLT